MGERHWRLTMHRKPAADETSREDLLTRDVNILFIENRQLKEFIEILKKENTNLTKQVGILKGLQKDPAHNEDEELPTFEEIAFYIEQQRKRLGLTRNELGALCGVTGATVTNYVLQKGGYKNALKFTERLRGYLREYGKRH